MGKSKALTIISIFMLGFLLLNFMPVGFEEDGVLTIGENTIADMWIVTSQI